MATCTCDCCNPDTPTTLNYTTKEINQILADGVINASVRYAPVGQNYLQLTLADALALVPDKERTTVRILTFLNKDTQPKAEVPVVANVTLKTMLIGENGLGGVVCIFGVTEKPSEAATVTYKATDSLGQEHTYVNSGTWGPPEGFNIPADYEAITPWTITFSEPGIYKSFNKLIDAKEGTLYAELYTTIQVEQS